MTRVAALLPAATDIAIALGALDQLVAVTHACKLPVHLTGVPRVTRSRVMKSDAVSVDAQVSDLSAAGAPLFELDEELLAAQRPSVVITQAVCDVCAVREEDARAVASRMQPPPVVATLGASTVEGIFTDIATVGATLAIADEAEELLAGLRSRVHFLHKTLKAVQAPRPRVLVLEWTDPAFSAGHWVPDMVRRAGGHEVIGQAGKTSRRLSEAEIRDSSPEVVVVAPCGYGLDETVRAIRAGNGAFAWLQSIPIWAIDANRLTSSPGPGVVHGIEVLASILHPHLFGDPSQKAAIQIDSPL